jgi:hypothetical protein
LLSGLLGIGGGFLMVPLQYFLLQSAGVDKNIAILVAFGTSLAIIVPTAISGAYKHNKDLNNIWPIGSKLGISGIFGGFLGGITANLLNPNLLEFIFGIVLLFIAIYNFFNKKDESNYKFNINLVLICIIGLTVGFLSGLLGIGGGIFLIIILNLFLGFSLIKSIGISSIFISFTAIGGVLSYVLTGLNMDVLPYSIGYINLIHLIVISVFSVPSAYIGAKVSNRIDEKKLKLIFSLLIFIISLKMIGIF